MLFKMIEAQDDRAITRIKEVAYASEKNRVGSLHKCATNAAAYGL